MSILQKTTKEPSEPSFEFEIEGKRRKKALIVPMKDISVIYRGDGSAAAFLMGKALTDGYTVISVGKSNSYDELLDITEETVFERLSPTTIKSTFDSPVIKGATSAARRAFTKIAPFVEKGNGENKKKLPDPTDRPCFYEISLRSNEHGTKSKGLYSEALLTLILTQYLTHDGAVELCLFIEAPFKPISTECIEALDDAIDAGLPVVYMYKDDGEGADKAIYHISPSESGLILSHKEKEYLIV